MKKHIVLFISTLVLGFGFASCNSDDDSSAPSVVGKWNLNKIESYDSNDELLESFEVEYDCPTKKVHYLDFKNNGDIDVVSYRTDCTERKYEAIGTWVQQNKKVILHLDGLEYESSELTKSTLVLKISEFSGYQLLYLTR